MALSIARNTITDDQQAYIVNVKSLNGGSGAVSAEASEGATINAGAFAASLAGAFAGVAGVAVSGAATTVENLIEANVQGYISNSTIGSAGDITASATNTSTINAITDAVSAALAGGGIAGVGVAVGSAVAQNAIGDGASGAGQVTAYVSDTSIRSTGALTVETISGETIVAKVGTISTAISGGFVGVSATAAGAAATNDIAVNVHAYIEDDAVSATAGQKGITAGSVTVSASDTAQIKAEVQASAVAAAFGAVAGAVAVGISVATNTITNDLEAYINDASDGVTATGLGGISITASETAGIHAIGTAAAIALSGGAIAGSLSGAGQRQCVRHRQRHFDNARNFSCRPQSFRREHDHGRRRGSVGRDRSRPRGRRRVARRGCGAELYRVHK
jgi:hypothetical protein